LRQVHRSLDEHDRERVLEWWKLAEERFKTVRGDPSWLTGYLAMVHAIGFAASSGSEAPPPATIVTTRVGYALRAFVDRFAVREPLDVSTIDRNAVATLASRTRDPKADILANDDISGTDAELLRPIGTLVAQTSIEGERFRAVVSVEPPFWNACVSIATYQIQKSVRQVALVRGGRQLDDDMTEGLLRYGFVLRCLDEALGIETPGDVEPPGSSLA
jgi:hypothetical protein